MGHFVAMLSTVVAIAILSACADQQESEVGNSTVSQRIETLIDAEANSIPRWHALNTSVYTGECRVELWNHDSIIVRVKPDQRGEASAWLSVRDYANRPAISHVPGSTNETVESLDTIWARVPQCATSAVIRELYSQPWIIFADRVPPARGPDGWQVRFPANSRFRNQDDQQRIRADLML